MCQHTNASLYFVFSFNHNSCVRKDVKLFSLLAAGIKNFLCE